MIKHYISNSFTEKLCRKMGSKPLLNLRKKYKRAKPNNKLYDG